MDLILDLFKDYHVEYDAKEKIIIINEEMPVNTFMQLRYFLGMTRSQVRDIQLYSSKLSKVRKKA